MRSSVPFEQESSLVGGDAERSSAIAAMISESASESVPQSAQPFGGVRRAAEVVIAASMLVGSAPLLLVAAAAVRLFDGSPVFYRGERLGRHRKPFHIIKIRTLRTDAQKELGGQLMSDRHRLLTRTGSFLRETRIDELPQLWLVVRGDMALFGPRPERLEVFLEKCTTIPNYTDRFLVRPGVFGYAQILTPHGTPKRLRARIDGQFVRVPSPPLFDMALLGLTVSSLVGSAAYRVARLGRNQWDQRVLRRYQEQRGRRRMQPARTMWLSVESYDESAPRKRVIDITSTALCVVGTGQFPILPGDTLTLIVPIANGNSLRRARIDVGRVMRRPSVDGESVVIEYEPHSENSLYVIEQYVLDKSIVTLPLGLRRRTARRAASV